MMLPSFLFRSTSSVALAALFLHALCTTTIATSSSSSIVPEEHQLYIRKTTAVEEIPAPPMPRRDEDHFIYAGTAPPNWDTSLPRQAANSSFPLLDPPVPIPDPYGWLRDDTRKNQDILEHLKAENEYTKSVTSHLKELQEELYQEFLGTLQETDYSAPRPNGKWVYYVRTYEGLSYSSYCRAPRTEDYVQKSQEWDGSKDSPILDGEEVYLDVNELAKNQTYCNVKSVLMSPSQEKVAYKVDYVGGERYELHVRDLASGEDVALKKKTETVGGTNAADADGEGDNIDASDSDNGDDLLQVSDLEWGKDDETLYYMTMDAAQRPYRLYKRTNWNSTNDFTDLLLKEETDQLFTTYVTKSFDERYIFYGTASMETSEVWYVDLTEEDAGSDEMKIVSPRRNKVLYDVESHDGSWYIVTNVNNSENMKLMISPAKPNSQDEWELVLDPNGNPIFDGSLDKSLDSIAAFKTYGVLEGREDGIPRIWTYEFDTKAFRRLEFEDADYSVGLSTNYEVDVEKVAISYSSMLTPPSTIEVSLGDDSQRTVLETKSVPGYDQDLYGTDRLHVSSRDGKTQIPISIVYKKDSMTKAQNGEPVPLHLYGYGSYGSSIEADFSTSRLPLLNRGMIYVIAHVRGGGEMGRTWYEEPDGGKLLCKKNTFDDFVDVARFLIKDKNWTTPEMLSCEGRSAGGLLVGASVNQAPDLFRVAIVGVPFVDVAVTMTDASIPLTSEEWIEWGNPNEEKYFQYMMDYSPMNNVQSGKKYPSFWITGGLHDPRVAYWEPAKFAATLRHSNPDNENPVCLKMDLSAGHFSASDRYKYYRELAYDYSFLLDQLNLVGEKSVEREPISATTDCSVDASLGLGRRLLVLGLCWAGVSAL